MVKARSPRQILQDHDFHEFKISVKASDLFLTVAAYQQLATSISRCTWASPKPAA